MKLLVLFLVIFAYFSQVQSSDDFVPCTNQCKAKYLCRQIGNCTDGYIKGAKTDCNCCPVCQKYIELGEQCYSKFGTKLKCREGLTCSPETKTCQYVPCDGVICDDISCDLGLQHLPADPTKCRCCSICGLSDDETGCEEDQKCDSNTGKCEG